jgi:hypothetical protein
MSRAPVIVGAGLAGLIAAHAWPRSPVFEAAPAPRLGHAALLRFRSDAVARLTGVDFRRVQVRKGVWSEGAYRPVDIRLANQYAHKCLGRIAGDRSIWSLEPVERFVAPDDFYERLIEHTKGRVEWDTEFNFGSSTGRIVSTAPLPIVLGSLGIEHDLTFERAPITVVRGRVEGADVFQTTYFPDSHTQLYRASITGSTLIAEFASNQVRDHDARLDLLTIEAAFGLPRGSIKVQDTVEQKYGKIAPLAAEVRKALLFRLTQERRIYSLGRFATWRNILLDDVVTDIGVIKNLLANNAVGYDLLQAAAR